MKIAHLTATFPPYFGGTGNVCFHNALELTRLGHTVSVFTAAVPGAVEQETMGGFNVRRLRKAIHFGNSAYLPQLAGCLAGFDIVHLHYPFFGSEPAIWSAHRQRLPLVITYHQDVLLEGIKGWAEKAMRYTSSRWVLRSAKRLLFTSLDYAQASHARPLLKGRESSIATLPNGVDTALFTPGPPNPELRHQMGLEEDDRIIVMVASLDRAHYFKGLVVLLRAMTSLPGRVKAVIVGEGEMRAQYEEQTRLLGIEKRVIFSGRVPTTALPDYYRLADVTVLPSTTMGEAFGLVLVESLACATPVITSNLPGVRTVVNDGVDGYLVKPGDSVDLGRKITQILALPSEVRRGMGRVGQRKVVEKYAWPIVSAQLESIYEDCLQ